MSVYVDNMEAEFGRMRMCHMIADSTEELLLMAKNIGVQTKWIQCAGTPREHFDICKSKRAAALALSAIPLTMQELAAKCAEKRAVSRPSPPAEAEEKR